MAQPPNLPPEQPPSASGLNLDPARRLLLEKLLAAERYSAPRPSIARRSQSGPARLSPAQERLMFLYLLEGPSATYNVCFAYLLTGSLEIAALEQALQQMVDRHEILRTRFAMLAGEPRQVAEPALSVRLQQEDLTHLPPQEAESEARRRAQEMGRQAFDLAQTPLFRFGLWLIGPERCLLLFSLHHNIFDEWSQGVFYRELEQAYRAASAGSSLELAALPIQYADFAEWQNDWQQGEAAGRQLAYWVEKLSGAAHTLELQTDFPRPAVQTFRGGVIRGLIPPEQVEPLRRLARSEDATLFNLLLAAFGVLLHRCSGQDDLLIGAPIANRRQAELENLIGLFLNTLAIRLRFEDRPTFRELLRRSRSTLAEALDNQDLPFDRLVEALTLRRDLSRHPLFQAAFVLHPASLDRLALDGVDAEPLRLDLGQARFDLTLFLGDGPQGIETRLEYAADLFSAASARRMLAQFEALLASIAANPDERVSRLNLLAADERLQLTAGWNRTRSEYPHQKGIAALFREAAAAHPEAEALIYADARLTYAELDERSDRLAQALQALGVGSEAPVGLRMERSAEMVIAMLAALKAGGSYLPLDPSYPAERLAFMIADSGVRVIVTRGAWQAPDGVQALDIATLLPSPLESAAGENQLPSPFGRGAGSEGASLAYIMYTSGSTGRPKGIEIPQRGVVRLVKGSDYLQVRPGERVGQASTMTFDAATFEVWGALLNGATLVGLEPEALMTPGRLAEALRDLRVDHLFLTTALFNQVAAAHPQAFSGLKTLMFGGEAANPEAARRVLAAGAPERLLNVYGPTESTTFATWHELKAVSPGERSLPIGLPIANTTAFVLDAELEPAPVGVPGELYLGGDGLARGYLRRPGLTAERFIPNPFGASLPDASGQTRLYRTGDRVCRLEDGTIEFLGRIDAQVKLRGFRIELEEIEAVLNEHPQVASAAVAVLGASEDKFLVGFVAAAADFRDASALRDFLHTRLPDYMIPARWAFVEALPLNANGKLDRRRLLAIDVPAEALSSDYAPPRDELEQMLARFWEEVLNLSRVGIHDDFFALGGHSLLAVRLFGRIEAETGQRLPLATLFETPTVAGLAQALRRGPSIEAWSALVPIQTQGDRPAFYCVHTFGGEALDLSPLSVTLGPDQPFYGLQAQGLDGVNPPHETIEAMAEYYLEAIRAHQPHGPYYLGGYCFGGVVAYEMACRLQTRGERVALVAAIDAGAPGHWGAEHRTRPQRIGDWLANLPNWMRDFTELPASERRVVIRRRLTRIRRGLRLDFGRPQAADLAAEGRGSDAPADHTGLTPVELIGANNVNLLEAPPHKQKLMEIHMRAIMSYRTPRYPGKVTVFRIRRMPLFSTQAPDLGWGRVAAKVDLRPIPGAHHNLLQSPYVDALAGKLRGAIDAAREIEE